MSHELLVLVLSRLVVPLLLASLVQTLNPFRQFPTPIFIYSNRLQENRLCMQKGITLIAETFFMLYLSARTLFKELTNQICL